MFLSWNDSPEAGGSGDDTRDGVLVATIVQTLFLCILQIHIIDCTSLKNSWGICIFILLPFIYFSRLTNYFLSSYIHTITTAQSKFIVTFSGRGVVESGRR